ncbi:MAG TPA: M14 family metallopeptidase [Candidatus Paceibacterota bacterium]|jgi:hypothetical protein
MKSYIIGLVAIVVISVGGYYAYQWYSNESNIFKSQISKTNETEPVDEVVEVVNERETNIGTSVGEHAITAYHYGSGEKEILFVGGIHGGYEWNTVLVAYELMDYLEGNPRAVPENERVTVIPVLNPDGLQKTVGTDGRFTASDVPTASGATVPGRFNGNEVDLNRNFDCDWQANATWQNRAVSGGSEAFSEPESKAVRDYILANKPDAVVVWYSAAGGVFASNCHDGVLSETNTLTKLYADASGYPAFQSFDFYEITGDMVNWLAKEKIPAISVLLTNHTDTEWSKNQKGILALLEYFAE